MSTSHDPEAIYQDADIEMMELAEAAADVTDDPCDDFRPLADSGWQATACRCGFDQKAHGAEAARR